MDEKEMKDLIEFTTGAALPEEVSQNELPSEWDLYVTMIDDERALILLDLSLARVAPLFKYNLLLGVQVGINNPTEDGFYSDEEQPKLFEIEDRVEAIFTLEGGCKYVATITTGGARMMYFYGQDETYWPSLVGKVAAEFGDYEFNYLIEQDAHWNFYYDVLYPGLMEMQLMKNRAMLKNLQEMGEDLEEVREVSHWYFFTNGAARRQAAVRLMSKGFEILDDNFYEEKIEEYPYGLRVLTKHSLTFEVLSEVTYEAYEFIEEFDGVYDGWDIIPDGDSDTWR